jgi:integrase
MWPTGGATLQKSHYRRRCEPHDTVTPTRQSYAVNRRPKGSGSVAERSPGVWRIRAFAGTDPVTGRPRQIERTFRGGRTAAEAEMRRLATEVDAGHHTTTAGTVSHLLAVWPDHLERIGRTQVTIESYRTIIRKHLDPALGSVQLRKLTALDIDRYYAARAADGLKAGSVRMHGAILSSALTQAMKWGWLTANPCTGATLPRRPEGTRSSPGVDGVRKLIETAGDDIDLATAVVLAALTGCRRGELCGLQWHDFDRQAGTIRVARARVPVAGGDATTAPKGKKARMVSIGALGVAVLDRYSEATDARALVLGVDREPGGRLPPGPHDDRGGWLLSHDCGRTPFRAKWLSAEISALGARAGVPVITHELRHFAATEMVGAGVDPVTAASRLGHTPEMLLRVYAHAIPSRDVEAARLLELGVLGPR